MIPFGSCGGNQETRSVSGPLTRILMSEGAPGTRK